MRLSYAFSPARPAPRAAPQRLANRHNAAGSQVTRDGYRFPTLGPVQRDDLVPGPRGLAEAARSVLRRAGADIGRDPAFGLTVHEPGKLSITSGRRHIIPSLLVRRMGGGRVIADVVAGDGPELATVRLVV